MTQTNWRGKCKSCGGPTVPAIDKSGKCPECVRLSVTVAEFGKRNRYPHPLTGMYLQQELRDDEGVVPGCFITRPAPTG